MASIGTTSPENVQDVFRIAERQGRQRVLKLYGSAAPLRPTGWGGRQRNVKTVYPGNPDATLQVFGPDDMPTEAKGVWRLRWLTREPVELSEGADVTTLNTPELLRDAFESIAREGMELEVSWAGILRFGVIDKWDFPHHRREDIEWTATFIWRSRGETVPRANATQLSTPRTAALEREFQGMADAVNAASRQAGIARGTTDSFGIDDVIGAARSIQRAVTRATAVADRAAKIVRQPLEAVNAFITVGKEIRAQVQRVADSVSEIPVEFMSTVEDADRMIDSWTSFHLSRTHGERVVKEMRRQENARREQVEPQFLDVVVVKSGQSLRGLAARYYDGDSDSWPLIADANGLESSLLRGGEVLLIPARR